ncbi:uncharacterized protein LOC134273302 [Saccostrea cucullata]|uniref:uncharacterized protein LOC134273302 n=1 Tax=Saccostrea cuccullata TaxID=36930 RepID=UPI002ED23851
MTTLAKADLSEIKALASPPRLVINTLEAVYLLLGYSAAEAGNYQFIKRDLGKPADTFLSQLNGFQAEKCDSASAKKAKALLIDVTVDRAKAVSLAASKLVLWALKALEECETVGKLQNSS